MKTIVTIFLIFTFSHLLSENTYSQKKDVEASFCDLSLSESIKQANTTFSNRYFVRLESENKPIKINRISGYDFINDEEIKSCISKWTFKNFEENTYFIVTFSWMHMYGWRPIFITSKGFSKAVKPVKKK